LKIRTGLENINKQEKSYGAEDRHIVVIRDQPSRQLKCDAAVAAAVREQRLMTGAVTEYADKRFVIIKIALRQNMILMQRMDDLSANGTKSLPIVSHDKARDCYRIICPITVVHRPLLGFAHIQAVYVYRRQSIDVAAQATYRERSSLMAKKHRRLRAAVLERLSSAEKYENEYGWFVSASAVQRIFAEMGVAG